MVTNLAIRCFRLEGLAISPASSEHMRYEGNRLTSFTNKGWTHHYAERLATAGFYLTSEANGNFFYNFNVEK